MSISNKLIRVLLTAAFLSTIQLTAFAQPSRVITETNRQFANTLLEQEKEAIRQLIANETKSYYRQDFEAWKSNFVDSEYFREYGYWEGYPEKVRYFNGFDTLKNFKQKQFSQNQTIWKGSYEKRYNENFRIYPNVAWYTFEEESYNGETDAFLGRSFETRILEKHNGKWKIAYLGFHYLPNKK
jgi:hypothetical protein